MTTALVDARKAWFDKNGRINFYDAPQQGMGFVLSQTTHIETEVYKIQYPEITYSSLVPVDSSAPEWVKSVTYFSLDKAGQAKWIHAGAKDVPLVGLVREKFETTVEMASIGYDWNIEELAHASMLGMNLTSEKADAARFAAEKMVESVAFIGDSTKNMTGLFNYSGITPVAVADGAGAGTPTNWEGKTATEILFDVNEILSDIYIDSLTTEIADTLLLPVTSFNLIATKPANDLVTVMEFLQKNNALTASTRMPLTIRAARQLETAATAAAIDSTKRMIAYRKDPRVLKMHVPMPFRFLPPWQDGPFHFEVPGIFRLGGLDIRRTGAVRYRDGI